MPAPPALSSVRTGTPDNSTGIQIADIASQEDANIKAPGGICLSDRIASGPSADRSALSGDDSATTDVSSADFGSTGLVAINNRPSIVVWCTFPNAAGGALVELVFYDAAGAPLFVSEQLTFTAKTQRLSASGDYTSQPQLIDSYGASKFRPFLRSKGTGNVNIFAQPI